MLFLTKDPTLGLQLLDGLLKYWPFAHAIKEGLFLQELKEILEILEITEI